jgi:rubrerythrin
MKAGRIIRDPLTRRRFFGRAGVTFAGGSAVFLSACGSSQDLKDEQEQLADTPEGDVAILNDALSLELTAVEAYSQALPLLQGAVAAVGASFLEQEREHVAAIQRAVKDLGGRPTKAVQEFDLSDVRSQDEALQFANNLENVAIAAYVDSIPKLSSGDLRTTAAQIVTNEAEHVTVLQAALGNPPVASAFVSGNPEALG